MDWRKIKITQEQKKELINAEKQLKSPKLIKRINCLKLKNKGWKHKEVADFLSIAIQTVSKWIKTYTEEGLMELLKLNYKGKISILSLEQQEILRKRNREKPFTYAKEVKDFIKKEFNIDFHLHWVQKILKKNSIYIHKN